MNPMGPMVYIDLFTTVISAGIKNFNTLNRTPWGNLVLHPQTLTSPVKRVFLFNRCFFHLRLTQLHPEKHTKFKNIRKLGMIFNIFFFGDEIFAKKVFEGLPPSWGHYTVPKTKSKSKTSLKIGLQWGVPPKKGSRNSHLPTESNVRVGQWFSKFQVHESLFPHKKNTILCRWWLRVMNPIPNNSFDLKLNVCVLFFPFIDR